MMENQMTQYLSFETERLILKPTDEADAEFIMTLVNTPKWLQYIGDRNVHSIEDSVKYIQNRMLTKLHRVGYGNYTIIRKSDGLKIGLCGLYEREGLTVTDIGFAFLPDFEAFGYGLECASRLLIAAKDDFKLTALSAITNENNDRSQRLLIKLGFDFKEKITMPYGDEVLYFYKKL